MQNYLDLLRHVSEHGIRQSNRTGVDCLTTPGAMLKFDLSTGFPAVTTKKLAIKGVIGELLGFLRGSSSLAEFKALGCNVWDENVASPKWQNNPACQGPDDMGRIYGVQWRSYIGARHISFGGPFVHVDQLAVALDTIRNDPSSRRIIVNAWNPAELNYAALPPCHVLFQLLPHVSTNELHMTMYMRSCDMFLGVPFNIASYAILLELFAAWTGYKAGTLTMFLSDVHIYVNHLDQVKEQLSREPMPLPRLVIPEHQYDRHAPIDTLLARLRPEDIQLVDYQHHPAIKAPMAV